MRLCRTALAATLLVCASCSEEEAPAPPLEGAPSMAPMAHGDHDPKYGGTVWMHGDLHFEVVLDAAGEHHVYLSDAYRVELPAAAASGVTLTILREGEEPETLEPEIDEFGESWLARGRAVADPASTRATVHLVHEGEPYEIDIPFLAVPVDPDAPDPHKMP